MNTTQKIKFYTKDFFSKCDQIHRKLRIWSHLLKKSLMKIFNFCAVQQLFSINFERNGYKCVLFPKKQLSVIARVKFMLMFVS